MDIKTIFTSRHNKQAIKSWFKGYRTGGLRAFLFVLLACCQPALPSHADSMEKVSNQDLVEVLPRLAWIEKIPDKAGLSVWIYGAGSRDLSRCREAHPYAEYAQQVFVGVEEMGEYPHASLFKTDTACHWAFIRWISVPISEPWKNDFVVFELEQELGENKRVKYAVSLNQARLLDETTYPSLSSARPLKAIPNRGSNSTYSRQEKYEGTIHELEIKSISMDGKTEVVVTDRLAASPNVRASFQAVLDGDWTFYQWASEEVTGEKDNYSVIRVINRTDPKQSWVGPKKDILINPWGAYIKDLDE